jgi:hypothetical protein
MILTSYLYISVHYRKNDGLSSKIVPVGVVTLWIQLGMANHCWKKWTVVEHGHVPQQFSMKIYAKMLSPITKNNNSFLE